MAKNYQNVPEHNFSRGIDARSSENLIEPGFVEDAINADVVEKRLRKRAGYEGHAGCLPLRVKEVEPIASSTETKLIFEDNIDLKNVRSRPIIVYGRNSRNNDDVEAYLDSYSSDPKFTISAETEETVTIESDEHDRSTSRFMTTIARSTSVVDSSNTFIYNSSPSATEGLIYSGSSDLDTAPTLEITLNNEDDEGLNYFVYYLDMEASSSDIYEEDNLSGTTIYTVPVVPNNNLIVRVFEETSTANDWKEIIPDDVIIDDNGTLRIRGLTSGNDYRIYVHSVADENFVTGFIDSAPDENTPVTKTITIENAESPFMIPAVYIYKESPFDGLYQVIPESVEYDQTTNSHNITFVNSDTASSPILGYTIFYDYGEIVSNFLTVDYSDLSSSEADLFGNNSESPQMTVWGICQGAGIYGGNRSPREGWVSGIDSYRRVGEERMVAMLGGNLFSEKTADESPLSHPTWYMDARVKIDGDTRLAPLVHPEGNTPGRTRGYMTTTDDVGDDNRLIITEAAHVSANLVDYTISAPGLSLFDSSDASITIDQSNLESLFSLVANFKDVATIEQCGHSRMNGEFRIQSVTYVDSETFTVRVENPNVSNSNYDETDVGGRFGVFTDVFTTVGAPDFLRGDTLTSNVFSASILVLDVADTSVLVSGVTSRLEIPNNILVAARRSSRVIPTRGGGGATLPISGISDVVLGDSVALSGYSRLFQVTGVNILEDETVDISGDGTTATITGISNTDSIRLGDRFLLVRSGEFSGEVEVTGVLSTTSIEVASEVSGSFSSGIIIGKTITIDESVEFEDSIENVLTVTVPRRWIPVEAPVIDGGVGSGGSDPYRPKNSYYRYFDSLGYADQDFIRSTIVNDSLFMTNGDDEVLKFDGDHIYRAGLPEWQPDVMITTDASSSAKLETATGDVTVKSIEGNIFRVAPGDEALFEVGNSIEHSEGKKFTVTKITSPESGDASVEVDRNINESTEGTIGKRTIYSYYLRLNMVDVNNNVIGSRAVRSEDLKVELSEEAAVNISAGSFPEYSNYDYSRLEMEIYRTKKNLPAPYYKLVTIPITMTNGSSRINFKDTINDRDLNESDLDPVNSSILGSEIGTQWTEPPRAKYLTSADNSLVLGNVKDYDRLRITLFENGVDSIDFSSVVGDVWTFNDGTKDYIYEFMDTSNAVTIDPSDYSSSTENAADELTINNSGLPTLSSSDPCWIYLYHSTEADHNSALCGWHQIVSQSGDNKIIYYEGVGDFIGTTSILPDKALIPPVNGFGVNTAEIPVPAFVEYNRETITNGTAFDNESVVRDRLVEAINATQRHDLFRDQEYVPGLMASGDGSFPKGEFEVRAVRAGQQISVTLPDYSDYLIYVNGILQEAEGVVQGITRVFPSRILVSYENYPEIFDNPYAVLPVESDSIVDVNPADGQEITGVIPFFGDSAFGAAQKSGIVVVFKTNSVYLVDINAKRRGENPVQKLETQGLGCTAPYSIAVTRDGIMFANESGIFRIRRDLRMEYIGRYMERFWLERTNRDLLSIMQGHHYGVGRRYKLSVPISNATENSDVYVYHHTGEFGETPGAWTRYTDHPATGWANLGKDAYFGSTAGRVFRVRRQDDFTDFRDDTAPISMSILTRALDLGNAGSRKVFGNVIGHYRALLDSSNTRVRYGIDLEEALRDTDDFEISAGTNKIRTLKSSLSRRKGVYVQVEISNDGIDEPLDLGGIDIRAALLNDRGIKDAGNT